MEIITDYEPASIAWFTKIFTFVSLQFHKSCHLQQHKKAEKNEISFFRTFLNARKKLINYDKLAYSIFLLIVYLTRKDLFFLKLQLHSQIFLINRSCHLYLYQSVVASRMAVVFFVLCQTGKNWHKYLRAQIHLYVWHTFREANKLKCKNWEFIWKEKATDTVIKMHFFFSIINSCD